MGERIAVIGGGVIGAACALALTRAGAEVVVLEAGVPGGVASSASFGWINASFHHDAHHFRLRVAAMEAWRRVGCVDVSWCGGLVWEAGDVAAEAERLGGMGYEVELWEAEAVARAVPGLAALPERAMFLPGEGVVELAEAARAMLAASGARVLTGCAVKRIEVAGGRVTGVAVEGGVVAADRVLVAAGCGAPGLVEPLGVALPMLTRPAVVLHTAPVAARIGPVLVPGGMEIRQMADGGLMVPVSPNHQADETEVLEASPEALAEGTLARLREMFPGLELRMAGARLAWRPVPGDGLPVVGPAGPEGLWLAVMHSGATLAPLIGELVAQEMGGGTAELLAPYRAERFAG